MTQPTLFQTAPETKPAAAAREQTGMPSWLRAHLETVTGDDYARGGIRRGAKPRPCIRCRAWTLAGLDNHICAFEAHVDLNALDATQELACIIGGRRTYEIWRAGGENKYEIDRRDKYAISSRPPNKTPRIIAVVAEHWCQTPIGQPIREKNHQTFPPGAPAPF